MKKKAPLGFKTPSIKIQEEYKELLEEIMAKKADWEKLLRKFVKLYKYADDGASDIIKRTKSEGVTHERLMEIEHRVLVSTITMTHLLVARIGKELAECDVRIAAVEKELKVLRRSL